MRATVGVAERDWVEPLDIELRQDIARRLLAGAGFELRRPSPDLARDDPWAVTASLGPADFARAGASRQRQPRSGATT